MGSDTPTRRSLVVGAAALCATSSCGVVPRDPDIGQLYRYTNEIDPALRRPLVTIPGLLGSRLRVGKDGEFVWGGPNRISIDTGNDRGAGLLALPVGDGTEPLSSLRDEIRPAGVLRRARAQVLFAQVQQEIYSNLVTALNSGGYEFSRTLEEERARQGENPGSLEFPYDWRRDIVESARELDDFIERKAVQIERVRRERFGRSVPADELRFDFVAHSMGGLVLRYWLMYGRQDLPADGSLPELTWAGARRAACVVFVAPPNLGSISAFDNLLTGRSFGPLQPFYRPALLATLPSLYQLMPRDRHQRVTMSGNGSPVDSIYDADTWRQRGWGLFASGEEEFISLVMPDAKSPAARQDIAQRHMTRVLGRAEALHRALDVPGTPRLTDLFLVVGTGLDTPAAATVDRDSGTATISAQEEGDGVVLRASALRDENQGGHVGTGPSRPIRYRTTLLLPGEHVEITASPVFADNLLHWLRDQPRARVSAG